MDEKTEGRLERDSDLLLRYFDVRGFLAALLGLVAVCMTVGLVWYQLGNDRVATHVKLLGFHAALLEFLYLALLDVVLLVAVWLLLHTRRDRP